MSCRRLASRAAAVSSFAGTAAALLLGVAAAVAGPAGAATAGSARVVAPAGAPGAGEPLMQGTSRTAFTLDLPDGAACPGDSTEGGYRVQSFMVSSRLDPASLTFAAQGPVPNETGATVRLPLYRPGSAPYANAATDLADEPGGEGAVINVPAFDLALFDAARLPAGPYRIGLACTRGTGRSAPVERLWSAALVLGDADESGGRSWTAPGAGAGGAGADRDGAERAAAPAGDGTDPGGDSATTTPAASTSAPASTVAPARTTRDAVTTGGPPTFHGPAEELVDLLDVSGSTRRSVAVWSLIAVLTARTARLLSRPAPGRSVLPRPLES